MYIGNRLRDTLCARFDIYFVLGNSSAAQTCSDTARSAGRAACAPSLWFSRWNSCALISKHWHHYIDDYRFRQRDTWLLKIFYDWRKAVSVPSRLMRQCQHRRKNWVCLGRDIFNYDFIEEMWWSVRLSVATCRVFSRISSIERHRCTGRAWRRHSGSSTTVLCHSLSPRLPAPRAASLRRWRSRPRTRWTWHIAF